MNTNESDFSADENRRNDEADEDHLPDVNIQGNIQEDEKTAQIPHVQLTPEVIHALHVSLLWLFVKIVAILVGLYILILLQPVLILLLLSVMLCAAFQPTVRTLQARYSRGGAVAVIVTASTLVLTLLLFLIVPPILRQSEQLLTNLPKYLAQIEKNVGHFGPAVHKASANLDPTKLVNRMGPETMQVVGRVFSGITGLVTIAVVTTYLLLDGPKAASALTGLLPRRSRLPVRRMFGELGSQVGDYVRAQLITSALAGGFTALLLLACGVGEPLALGFWMAIADAIPLVGLFIGVAPAVLAALSQNPQKATIVFVALLTYHPIESYIIVPRVYGKTMKLSPLVITIAILVGATLMGILGALLALPAAAAIPVVWRHFHEWRARQDAAAGMDEEAIAP